MKVALTIAALVLVEGGLSTSTSLALVLPGEIAEGLRVQKVLSVNFFFSLKQLIGCQGCLLLSATLPLFYSSMCFHGEGLTVVKTSNTWALFNSRASQTSFFIERRQRVRQGELFSAYSATSSDFCGS